jgi:hypothetical protein
VVIRKSVRPLTMSWSRRKPPRCAALDESTSGFSKAEARAGVDLDFSSALSAPGLREAERPDVRMSR